jgi:hypothetical protein
VILGDLQLWIPATARIRIHRFEKATKNLEQEHEHNHHDDNDDDDDDDNDDNDDDDDDDDPIGWHGRRPSRCFS